ncbi:hypothetical protein [Shinella zoogloeoides]
MSFENEQETAERMLALRKARTRGLTACVDAAIELCENKEAPAAARASAVSSLMRANNLFSTSPNDPQKELHEMTAAELKAVGDQLERDRRAWLAQMEAGGGVFD